MKQHPVQVLLESQNIRTFSYSTRPSNIKCLGAYCTLGGLLRAVSYASRIFSEQDLSSFIAEINGATTTSGRLFYWPNVKYAEHTTTESTTHLGEL